MDKQQSDHIEHRIRQAAENITPPYKEEGWQKMEVLLDKEFNKKRRRGFIWWWYALFVCLIIGAGYYYYKNTGSEASKSNDVEQKANVTNGQHNGGISKSDLHEEQVKTTTSKATTSSAASIIDQQTKKSFSADPQKSAMPYSEARARKPKEIEKKLNKERITGEISNNISSSSSKEFAKNNRDRQGGETHETGEKSALRPTENKLTNKNNGNDSMTEVSNPGIQHQTNLTADSTVVKESLLIKDTGTNAGNTVNNNDISTKTNKLKISTSIAQPGLYFIASIASDGSRVQKFTLDNRKPVYGVGMGYRFNNRISLQTGFYAGRKIYTAGPTDYKANPDSYLGRVKIMRIEADCIIYELPLSFRYDVIAHKNFRAYAIAGLSSFIMKREKYKYHLTGSMGYMLKDTTITNNKNFFSSAGLSIGFEQKLFNSFYIQAEPYIRMPISGVGEGKVRLYSAGLQFGIKYQPVKNKKKHS